MPIPHTNHITIGGTPMCVAHVDWQLREKAYKEARVVYRNFCCGQSHAETGNAVVEWLRKHGLDAALVPGGCPEYGRLADE